MKEHGPWQIVQSTDVYRDTWLHVRLDDVVRPDGLPGTHTVTRIRAGVCVLAVDNDHTVHLTEEFHYAVGRVTLEGVSGGIEEGESALETAQRELQEELGISAGRWTNVGTIDPFTSMVVSPTQLYLAEELSFGETACEGTEQIRHHRSPLSELVAGIGAGQITHAPTCILVLHAARHFGC